MSSSSAGKDEEREMAMLEAVLAEEQETKPKKQWPRLAGWYTRPRGWNVRVKEKTLRRFDCDAQGGGVCYGSGRLPSFQARSTTTPASCFCALTIDVVNERTWAPGLTLAIGVTSQPPDTFTGNAWRAYAIADSFIAGYGKNVISNQKDWMVSPWDPSTLK